MRPSTLASLADALGLTIDYLVRGGQPTDPMFVHCALLYRSDEVFADSAGRFLRQGLERGEPTLAVTTEANFELLRGALGPAADAVQFEERGCWYRTPATALSSYREFLQRKLGNGASWVRILGEPPRDPDASEDVRALTRYEATVNLGFGAHPVSVMCPYDTRGVADEVIAQVRATHPHAVEHQGFVDSADYVDPLDLVLGP